MVLAEKKKYTTGRIYYVLINTSTMEKKRWQPPRGLIQEADIDKALYHAAENFALETNCETEPTGNTLLQSVVSDANTTLSQYATSVFMPRKQITLAEHTRDLWQRCLTLRILPRLGSKPLGEITSGIINDFLLGCQSEGLAIGTVRQYYGVLRQLFKMACQLDNAISSDPIESYLYFLSDTLGNEAATRNRKLVAIRGFYNYLLDQQEHLGITLNGNPASRISRPKQAKKLPVYLPAEDQKALLNTIGGENGVRDYAIFLLLLTTGMRISELVNINMTDLNLKGRTIRIHGKGNKERTANLTEPCCDAIRRYLEEYRDLIPEGDLLSPALFTSKRRRDRLTARGLEKTMRNYVLAAGLGGLGYTPHKLRHTMATMLAKDGVDLMVIQNVLGHADPGTTEIYTHLDSSDIRAAIQKSSVRELGAIRPISPEGDSNDPD